MITLPHRTWGTGPLSAVFLHGFTGSRFSFDHLEPLLGETLTARCVELPGHHESTSTPANFDEVVDAIGGALGTKSVLIGYSQGARLALAVAAKFPQKVERLVLESGSPGLRRRHDRSVRRRSDEALASLIETSGVEAFIGYWENLPLFSGIRALPTAVQERLRARRVAHSASGLAMALRVMGQGAQPDLWPALPTLRIPTLVLSGALDAKYTRLARRMVDELPLAWRMSFRGVGHAPHLEIAEAYASEVRSFLLAPWTHEPVVEVTR